MWNNDKTGVSYDAEEWEEYTTSKSYMTEIYTDDTYYLDVLLSMMHVGVAGMDLGLYDGVYS